jgi:hypothetical protein
MGFETGSKNLSAQIISSLESEEERIAEYLKEAETAFGVSIKKSSIKKVDDE